MVQKKKQRDFSSLESSYRKFLCLALCFYFFLLAFVLCLLVIGNEEDVQLWPRYLQLFLISFKAILLISNSCKTNLDVYCLCPCAIDSRPLSKMSYHKELGLWYVTGLFSTYCVFWWVPAFDIYYFISDQYNIALFVVTLVSDFLFFVEFWLTRYLVWSKGIVWSIKKNFGTSPIKTP